MKTIFKNGKIYMNRDSFCEALLVEDGVIKAAGTNEEILAAAGREGGQPEVIDCEGKTVVPGFNDCHMHLFQFGEFISGVRIADASSIDMIVERGRAFISEHPALVRRGMHALGWNQDYFTDEKRIPDRHDLDRISRDIPIVMERVCGHISSANTKAIEMLLEKSGGKVPMIEGGDIEVDGDGYPTGIFKENAVNTSRNIIPERTADEWYELALEGMRYAVSRGYTSLQSNDLGFSGLKAEDIFSIMKKVHSSGKMCVRYRHQCSYSTLADFEESLTNGEYSVADREYTDRMLTFGPLKLFADGSLGARTALLGDDYADDPGNRGIVWTAPEEMLALTKAANEKGIQVITHAIGDQAMRNVLDVYEAADPTGTNPCRNAINHCQISDRKILDRIRDGNILTAVQPIFLRYDIHMAEDRVGPELASTSYAFNTLFKEGVHQAFGTDAPIEDLAPLPNIYSAVTRKDLEGEPEGGWYPHECMDVYDAVDCATIGSAYMEFAEDDKGRLLPGYLADIVILDKDVFTCPADEIKDIKPVMTMVGGEIVYRAG